MHLVLILALAVLFPAVHILNNWLFDFANVNPHISLIYLPAFLRLFNLLVMGPRYGTLATMLGGVILLGTFNETWTFGLMNVACSSLGPVVALFGFRFYFKRRVQLSSLRDLTVLTLAYCLCNSVIHHLTWQLLESSHDFDELTAAWMFIGDLNGALIGAYFMKAIIDFMEKRGVNFSDSSQPKN
jgi:hypothetical protein